MLSDFDFNIIVNPLLEWFQKNARILPWRENPTPYHVWVSEIMLQQTRVEAVKPYFERFTKELPDVRALAECPQERLLKLWEGLWFIKSFHKTSLCLSNTRIMLSCNINIVVLEINLKNLIAHMIIHITFAGCRI